MLQAVPALLLPRVASAVTYDPVDRGRAVTFPRDHGAHPGFRTEWWYLTGWLERDGAAPCGFQVTFFRSRTGHADANPSRFAPKQLLFAHAALALPENGRLIHEDRSARVGPAGVRFSETDTALAIGDWSCLRDAGSGRYAARIAGRELDLAVEIAPPGPPVLQGEGGFSQKGPRPEQASHYYSRPQLAVRGRIAGGRGAARRAWSVRGRAWLDHEWSSTLLDERAAGWDWIGINLDDGGSLMAFRIRARDGGVLWSHVARRDAQGRPRAESAPAQWTPTRWWTSPRSQARYPVGFEVTVGADRLTLEPLMDDQEIDARASTGGFYWEGAVAARVGGQPAGRGYLELTGYAAPMRL
ncbi:MAG: carotenoid 1,2-hydratase [Burkholderiales bacterium]|nr:carotenoid 1,2-hydratase [Burkholderiales bacterium]